MSCGIVWYLVLTHMPSTEQPIFCVSAVCVCVCMHNPSPLISPNRLFVDSSSLCLSSRLWTHLSLWWINLPPPRFILPHNTTASCCVFLAELDWCFAVSVSYRPLARMSYLEIRPVVWRTVVITHPVSLWYRSDVERETSAMTLDKRNPCVCIVLTRYIQGQTQTRTVLSFTCSSRVLTHLSVLWAQ